jgi:DNA-binding LacI/PurR family transcriptional regulator
MAATLHDVARVAGVSIKTVSNVVNDYPHIRAGTRERVLDAIVKLGYQPNLSARSLRSGRSGVIGLAIPELSLSYFAELADEVIQAASARGLVVLVEQTGGGDRQREIELLRSPRLQLTDGLLFSPLGLSNDDKDVVDVDYPLVLLGERIFDGPADHVTMQNVEAARAATEYLLSIGRTRIAAIGAHAGEVIGSAGLRLTGYQEALAAAGIEFDPQLVVEAGLWHRANGADAARRLIDRAVEFDSVFAFNDNLALGAMRVLQEAGYRIPDDVAVIGFDDLDEARYSLPTLTSVDPGRRQIAETAVRVLVERISAKNGDLAAPRELRSDFQIVPRGSTGAGAH